MKLSTKLTFKLSGNFTELQRWTSIFDKQTAFAGKLPPVQPTHGNPHGGPPGHNPGHGGGGGPPPPAPPVWTTSGTYSLSIFRLGGVGSSNSAALGFGGQDFVPDLYTTVKAFNGTSWSVVASLSVARGAVGSAGTEVNAVCMTGNSPTTGSQVATAEKYNGTSWSSASSVANTRSDGTGFGASSTAAVQAGGTGVNPHTGFNLLRNENTSKYNGTSWAADADMTQQRRYAGSAGTYAAALIVGGELNAGNPTVCDSFNGVSYSVAGSLLANDFQSPSTSATANTALKIGGSDGITTKTECEQYDGATWTVISSLNQKRTQHAASGTGNSALTFCGFVSSGVWTNTTEKYQ